MPVDPRGMFWANLCFAWGGLIILAAASSPFVVLVCGLWFVIGVYFAGWVNLARAMRSHRPLEERVPLTMAFVVAPLAGFAASLALFPLLLPVDGWTSAFILYGAFLYVPTCWTAILVAHGALLLVASRRAGARARAPFAISGIALLQIAVVGVVVQALWVSRSLAAFSLIAVLPGLTGPAYALAALGWWRELSVSGGLFRQPRTPLAAFRTERP